MTIDEKFFGKTKSGIKVKSYILTNKNKMEVKL